MWALIGSFFQWIFGAFADIGAAIASALSTLWAVLRPIFGNVWGALSGLWNNALGPALWKFSQWLDKLRSWWQAWAKPVTDFLSKLSQLERAIYSATFGPILDSISNLEKLIVLLHLTNTQLGKDLLGALQSVYVDINHVWQVSTQTLNQIINTIEGYILDVDGLLAADLLIASTIKNFERIWNTWWNLSIHQVSPAARATLDAARRLYAPGSARAALEQHLQHQTGPFAPAVASARAVFDQVLAGHTPPTYAPGSDTTV